MKHSMVSVFAKAIVLMACVSLTIATRCAWGQQLAEPPIEALDLGFEGGTLGQPPEGWFVASPGWAAELVDAHAADGTHALVLKEQGTSDAPFGNVMCVLDAAPYRGKTVTLSAQLRVQGPNDSQAMMWLRADLDDGSVGAFDNMHDRPIRPFAGADWTTASFDLNIEANAVQLAIGFLSVGGATVFIDAVQLSVDENPDSAPQSPSEPRPLSDRGLANLEAATRLLAYVRFFHASDQVTPVKDWEHLAVALVEQAEPAADADELADILARFFAPLAPTLQIWAGGPDEAPALPKQPESVQTVVYWQHTGVGNLKGSLQQNVYSSEVQHDRLPFKLPWGKGRIDPETYQASFLIKPLGGGVTCRLPVKVFADDQGTLPHVPNDTEWSRVTRRPRLTADNRSTRLAGVALCWGTFQHFYPYFDVVDTDWDAALSAALSAAAEDADSLAYLHTLQELIAQLHDGHGNVYAPNLQPRTMIPLAFSWVGDQLIVTGVDASAASKVNVGDEVLAIDGTSVVEWTDLFSKRISSATDGWRRASLERHLACYIPGDTDVRLSLARPDGERVEVELPRIAIGVIPSRTDRRPENGAELAPGIVYFNLHGAASEDFTPLLPTLASAQGIVFDLRGYPGTAGIDVVSHLCSEPIQSARWNIPIATLPDRQDWKWNSSGRWSLTPRTPRLTAHIVFLTDGGAISYAESIMGIVEAYELGDIVGSTTAGTNGNINPFELPGGYRVIWTGMKVLKHDGSRHHGVGIAPTVPVEPTVAGIAADRDEVLETGVKVLQQQIDAGSGD